MYCIYYVLYLPCIVFTMYCIYYVLYLPCIVFTMYCIYHVLYLLSVHFVIYVFLFYMLTSCNTYIVSERYLIKS
jgi:hypothetical protein